MGMHFLLRPGAFRDPEFVVAIRKVRTVRIVPYVHSVGLVLPVRTCLAREVRSILRIIGTFSKRLCVDQAIRKGVTEPLNAKSRHSRSTKAWP